MWNYCTWGRWWPNLPKMNQMSSSLSPLSQTLNRGLEGWIIQKMRQALLLQALLVQALLAQNFSKWFSKKTGFSFPWRLDITTKWRRRGVIIYKSFQTRKKPLLPLFPHHHCKPWHLAKWEEVLCWLYKWADDTDRVWPICRSPSDRTKFMLTMERNNIKDSKDLQVSNQSE